MIRCSKREEGEKDNYWPKDYMNDVIALYKKTEQAEERSEIYENHIHEPLVKMNEIWARKILGQEAIDNVITDGLAFAVTRLDKFDLKYGDSFGYLSVCIKRYYQNLSISRWKYDKLNVSLDSLQENEDGETREIELKPTREESFRDEDKVKLLMEFLGDERSYALIRAKLDVGPKSLAIKHLKNLYQLLQINDDSLLKKHHFAKLLVLISPVFLKWLENRPEGPAIPVELTKQTKLIICKCHKCGTVVMRSSTYRETCKVTCQECKDAIKLIPKPSKSYTTTCPQCKKERVVKYLRNPPRVCKDCKRANRVKIRAEVANRTYTIRCPSCKKERVVTYQMYRNNLRKPKACRECRVPATKQKYTISCPSCKKERVVSYQLYLTNQHNPKACRECRLASRGVPARKQSYTISCPSCNKERVVSYQLYLNNQHNPKACRECRLASGGVPARKQSYTISCPSCNKERVVNYKAHYKHLKNPKACRECRLASRGVPASKQSYTISCPSCNKERVVNYKAHYKHLKNPKACKDCRRKAKTIILTNQTYTISCPKCNKERNVSVSMYHYHKRKPRVCKDCRYCNNGIPFKKRTYPISCPSCNKERVVTYQMYRNNLRQPTVCRECRNAGKTL